MAAKPGRRITHSRLPGKSYSVPEVNIRWSIQVEIHEAVQHDGRKRSRARQSHVATIIRRLVHSRPDRAPEDSEHEQQGSQGSLTLNGTATQNLTLNLSAPAPAGLAINLSSSNVSVATVPARVSFGTGTTTVSVPVTGVAAGSVTITASATNIASATASVTVTQAASGRSYCRPARRWG